MIRCDRKRPDRSTATAARISAASIQFTQAIIAKRTSHRPDDSMWHLGTTDQAGRRKNKFHPSASNFVKKLDDPRRLGPVNWWNERHADSRHQVRSIA